MSLTSKAFVLDTLKRYGKITATELQAKADTITGTEVYEEETFIPTFAAAIAKKNMSERKAGFLCKSSAGHIVKLLTPYDSTTHTGEPEELLSLWGFFWSKDPKKARPFVASSTSPYNTDDCCTENDEVYQSTMEGNVWAPSAYPQGWKKVEL